MMFQSVFWLAQFPMDWIDQGFSWRLHRLKDLMPGGFLTDLLVDGVLAGINGIVVFYSTNHVVIWNDHLAQDSGYMSRISFLTDRLMRSVGLNGKSVMPMISATACAVPAIMAARTIENKKEKLITILITPFMSCSARLPVYTILIGLVIPEQKLWGFFSLQGLMMMALYILGFLMALLAAWVMNRFIAKMEKSIFLMELPVYRMPRWKNAGITMTLLQKARVFVTDAGKIILLISVILWALSSYGPGGKWQTITIRIREFLCGYCWKKY